MEKLDIYGSTTHLEVLKFQSGTSVLKVLLKLYRELPSILKYKKRPYSKNTDISDYFCTDCQSLVNTFLR